MRAHWFPVSTAKPVVVTSACRYTFAIGNGTVQKN